MEVKILSLETFIISIPLKSPIHMNDRCIKSADNVIVKMTLSNGIVGWGEAPSAARMTGETVETIKCVINSVFFSLIVGKNIDDYQKIINSIKKSIYGNTGSKNAVSVCILDCYTRFKNIPFYQLLGTVKRDRFKTISILGKESWRKNIDEALELQSQGFDNFKIKVASKDIKKDIEGTIDLRKNLGNNSIISADANAGLNLNDSIDYIDSVSDTNLIFFEQPLLDMFELSQLQKTSSVDLCGDESISSEQDIKLLHFHKSIRGVNLKLIKFSDPISLVSAGNFSNSLNLKVNISGKVAETGILTSALLHCASVLDVIDWGISTTNQYLIKDIVYGLEQENSYINLPRGPGLGISVDENILKSFLVG